MNRYLLLIAVVMMGCGPAPLPGAPTIGSSCTAVEPECITAGEVAYCEGGKWAAYACPGECRNAQSPRCDWQASSPGDACPESLSGSLGFCASDSRMLRCDGGRFVAVECSGGCTKSGDFHQCMN